jgi:hypothetical protein
MIIYESYKYILISNNFIHKEIVLIYYSLSLTFVVVRKFNENKNIDFNYILVFGINILNKLIINNNLII